MAFPVLFGISAGLGLAGNYLANQGEKKAREQNIKALIAQQKMAQMAAQRQEDLFKTESAQAAGDQIHAIAMAGVDMSGSALAAAAATKVQISNELAAIRLNASNTLKMFDAEIRSQRQAISQLNDPLYNIVQTGTTLLNSYSMARNVGLFSPQASGPDRLQATGQTSGGLTNFEYVSPTFGRIGGR